MEPTPKDDLTSPGSRADRMSGAILALLMFLALALVSRQILSVASGPLPPGRGIKAPEFSLPNLDGDAPIALLGHRGEVVLVDFWATWCPPCVAAMPGLEALYRKYHERGFVVLGVNQEPDAVLRVRHFARNAELSFPIGIDSGATARQYGVYSYPTSFLIDRSGRICRVYRGPVQEHRLGAAIEALLDTNKEAAGC